MTLGRRANLLRDGMTAKAMGALGPHAFGPRCSQCGRHKTHLMLPRHREYTERKLGHPLRGCECPR